MNTNKFIEVVVHVFLKHILLYVFGTIVLGTAFALAMGYVAVYFSMGEVTTTEDWMFTVVYGGICYLLSMAVTRGAWFKYIAAEVEILDKDHEAAMARFS